MSNMSGPGMGDPPPDATRHPKPRDVVLVVDVANTLGTRPDGWWRDRLGATEQLLARLEGLDGAQLAGPDGESWRVVGMVAVVEGRARTARAPDSVRVLRAEGSGDDALAAYVATAREPADLVVVTADRGLRARVTTEVAGPGWLRRLLD